MVLSVTCPGCGSQVPAGDRFCGTCGNPITGSAILTGEGAGAFDPWVELLQKLRQATLGEYEIKGELGRGGMAAVFLAHDLHLNRKVAVKVMLPGLLYSERMWERFLAEARTAAKLDHPNIIYIHSVKDKDRFLYFVMKYVDGRALDDLLSRPSPLPLAVAQTILVEVARGLDYAHREGVVHRDIKPANIMVDNKGAAIVMDFGIARVTDSAHFTQTGATIGTPAYMSPEQCHGHDVNAASDQYSLGVVAYEMFSGKPPFTGSPIELQLAHIQDTPLHVGKLRKDLPPEMASAIMRMLEKDPAKRFPSLAQLVVKFAAGLDSHDESPRQQLIEMVKTGPTRRQSYPETPVSPPLGSVAAAQALTKKAAKQAKAPNKPKTTVKTPVVTPIDDEVHSAETAAVPAMSDDAQSRPTASIASGPHDALTYVGGAPVGGALVGGTPIRGAPVGGASVGGGPVGGAPFGGWPVPGSKKRFPPAAIAAAVVLIAVVGFMITRPSGPKIPPTAAPDANAAQPPAQTAAGTAEAALGDSVVVGHGPDATVAVKGATPKTVSTDAVALLTLSLPKGPSVGDTVRMRLEAIDDTGAHVTSPQIVWATSNAHVVKFAGPGRLVGVREGKATITVSAGGTTATHVVTVAPKVAAPNVAAPAAKQAKRTKQTS